MVDIKPEDRLLMDMMPGTEHNITFCYTRICSIVFCMTAYFQKLVLTFPELNEYECNKLYIIMGKH